MNNAFALINNIYQSYTIGYYKCTLLYNFHFTLHSLNTI